MLWALLLDWLGQLLVVALIWSVPALTGTHLGGRSLYGQEAWVVLMLLLYPLLGWLFGSYTVLGWRRFTLLVLLQRLLITAVVTLLALVIARWLINPSDSVWLLDRHVQLLWIGGLSLWAFAVRVGLRQGLLLPEAPKVLLFVQSQELESVLEAWRRVPHRQSLQPVDATALSRQLDHLEDPVLVVYSHGVRHDPEHRSLFVSLEMSDSRQVQALSVLSLFDQHQERLPPVLMDDTFFVYENMPWAATFSVQAQLKRMADLLVAALLLLMTAPFVSLAALLIWLEDGGPVLYAQQRSGWLGRPFTVYKLRTMTVQPDDAPPLWTQPGDNRITVVGDWLRRFRLDELPQLLNVLSGEMSLIGPRPERPELEDQLERRIPHYRKRHWMRPGLSGWAQVCAPYASSIEDSDLKLSYDLYYLRHFSTWLDLVILLRTVKTVLKAGGR